MKSLQDILGLWPSREDIASVCGVTIENVHLFFRKDRTLPPKFDLLLYRDAIQRGLDVTLDEFISARCDEGKLVNLTIQGKGQKNNGKTSPTAE